MSVEDCKEIVSDFFLLLKPNPNFADDGFLVEMNKCFGRVIFASSVQHLEIKISYINHKSPDNHILNPCIQS